MREITIKIDKKTLKASIDMEGYEGQECTHDFSEIMSALNTNPDLVVDKTGGVVDARVNVRGV